MSHHTSDRESQLAELQEAREALLARAEGIESVDRQRLVSRLRSSKAILIDVRPREEYDAGYLAGAVSMPLEALAARLKELKIQSPTNNVRDTSDDAVSLSKNQDGYRACICLPVDSSEIG